MISVAEADSLLAQLLPPPSEEQIPLDLAVGRVLTSPLSADRDGPPYDRVAMDGFAVDSTEAVRGWTIRGLQCAGKPPMVRTGLATAIEVATGAVLPSGCNSVVPYEQTDRQENTVTLLPGQDLPKPADHVHRRGSDYRAGQVLLPAGTRLSSPHLHSLATVGVDPVSVVRRPVWALSATGDELVEVGDQPLDWQIRRSNAAAISGEARAWGLAPRDQVVLPDDKAGLIRGLERLLPGLDVVVLTGGVSAGVRDLIPSVLTEMGARTVFHKIAQRPGKPFWCGQFAGSKGPVVFGLPGNPVSSLFAFRRYVLPWLLAAEGRPPTEQRVRVAGLTAPAAGIQVFLPWSLSLGRLDWGGSGNFLSLAASSGFIEIGGEPRSLEEPRFYAWGGIS